MTAAPTWPALGPGGRVRTWFTPVGQGCAVLEHELEGAWSASGLEFWAYVWDWEGGQFVPLSPQPYQMTQD